MKRIVFITLILCFIIQGITHGQSCIDVNFPRCPGQQEPITPLPPTLTYFKMSTPCDTTIIQPQYGTVTIDTANANVDSIYYYNPSTNCSLVDTFMVVECCDSMGQILCDTMEYYLHLTFQCEIPDELYCCIPNEGQDIPIDVLLNDTLFVKNEYPGYSFLDVELKNVSTTTFGTLETGAYPYNYYIDDPNFMGIDSFTYDVVLTIKAADGKTYEICLEQTCYIVIEDCLNTVIDEAFILVDDFSCLDPTANDFIQPTISDPLIDKLECQNELPEIDTTSFTFITDTSTLSPNVFQNGSGDWCFEPTEGGTFIYLYEICTTSGACAIDTIRIESPCVQLDIYAYLEGAYDSTLMEMTTSLNDLFLLPGQIYNDTVPPITPAGQPYDIAPWNYSGTEGAGWTNYDSLVTDWVLVSFRTDIAKNTEVAMTAALLNKDGSMTFPDNCVLPAPDTALHIVVEHRNHLGIMSAAPVNYIGDIMYYDFRTTNSYTGTGSGQKEITSGVWTMYAGDGNQFDAPGYDINANDKIFWSNNNGFFNIYSAADYNLNGDISGGDKSYWQPNNGIFSVVPR